MSNWNSCGDDFNQAGDRSAGSYTDSFFDSKIDKNDILVWATFILTVIMFLGGRR